MTALNPFLTLDYEPAFESLGEDYADLVAAASFPRQVLRFRNDDLLERLGLSADQVQDDEDGKGKEEREQVRPER